MFVVCIDGILFIKKTFNFAVVFKLNKKLIVEYGEKIFVLKNIHLFECRWIYEEKWETNTVPHGGVYESPF